MDNIVEITDFLAPELDVYARLSEVQLLNREFPEKGLFIAVGTDYHTDIADNRSGIIVPDDIQTSVELANYLKSATYTEVFIHDMVEKFEKNIIN